MIFYPTLPSVRARCYVVRTAYTALKVHLCCPFCVVLVGWDYFNTESIPNLGHNKVKPKMKKDLHWKSEFAVFPADSAPPTTGKPKQVRRMQKRIPDGCTCPFHTCAVKRKGKTSAGFCDEITLVPSGEIRESGKQHDFICLLPAT